MVDVIKKIKQILVDLSFKPVYTKKSLTNEISIKNGWKDDTSTYEIYFSDELKFSVRNIFKSDKDYGYAARYIYNTLMCDGLI